MLPPASADEQRDALRRLLERLRLDLARLWVRYFALGGNAAELEVEGFLSGLLPLPAGQRDILAHAVNEYADELTGFLRVPYSRTVREPLPERGILPALVSLLEDGRCCTAGQLPAALARAGALLGARSELYLADYQQYRLVPVGGATPTDRLPLSIDGTLPGLAYRTGEIVTAVEDEPRLWVPVVDGNDRLGVLDLVLDDPRELHDRALHRHCRWLAGFAGRLIAATRPYSDTLDLARRAEPRSRAAELVWQLLPPTTAASDNCTVAAVIEPSYAVGGDIFDYTLSPTAASLAIFDGVGHDLPAGLQAAASVSSYRAARRRGERVAGQAIGIDEALVALANPDSFVTGVLAELELDTGWLSYLTAGHPAPLLLRGSSVVTTLDSGHRLPFGIMGTDEQPVGRVHLQPGDMVVFYTDGVVEARDATGEFFGVPRLCDFFGRAAAAEQPAAETLRRLIHAVLDHHDGVLQDDATVLVAHWHPRDRTSA